MLKGELYCAHDARAESITIHESGINLRFRLMLLYVPESSTVSGIWKCRAELRVLGPKTLVATWHQMSLWILDSVLTVGGIQQPWEALLDEKEDVSLSIDWSNGAKFSITEARSALLSLDPLERCGEVRDE